ncbi:MAG: sterol desaturase family protein [Candidatus Obscuribacterales bacterium]|nr:sterol desaturase family protein [Candidatus Obscuribacterales bacterium]
MLLVEIGGWIVICCIFMSFVEHQVHSRLMHKQNFLSRRSASFKRTFEAHAITHHKHYLKIFSDEPVPPGEDKEIRLTVRKAPIKALPVALVLALFSWKGALILIGTVTAHHWIWNKIHLEMHKPEQKPFSNWPIYKFLARYHYLHHKYPDRNFNVVFPLADYILGTHANAREADLQSMRAEGLY